MIIKARYVILLLILFAFSPLTANARMLSNKPMSERHQWVLPRAEAPAGTMGQVATPPEMDDTLSTTPQQEDMLTLDTPDSMPNTPEQVLTLNQNITDNQDMASSQTTNQATAATEEEPTSLFSQFSLGFRDRSSGGRMGFKRPGADD